MSHLGDRLSALVDGELGGAERDRASAHLARCAECRAEAAALRDLKRQLRALAVDAPAEPDLAQRLLAATAAKAAQAVPSRPRVIPRPRVRVGAAAKVTKSTRAPETPRSRGQARPKLRGRYLVLGTMSIVVSLGTAAFTVGGGEAAPGPKITPQVQLFSEEHAITTGEVPFSGPPSGNVEGPDMLPVVGASVGATAEP